jgi:hypothetical protein
MVGPTESTSLTRSALYIDPNGIRVHVHHVLGEPIRPPPPKSEKDKENESKSEAQGDSKTKSNGNSSESNKSGSKTPSNDAKVSQIDASAAESALEEDLVTCPPKFTPILSRLTHVQIPVAQLDTIDKTIDFYQQFRSGYGLRKNVTWSSHDHLLSGAYGALDGGEKHIVLSTTTGKAVKPENQQGGDGYVTISVYLLIT